MAEKVALLGGVYSNYLALEAAITDALGRGVESIYCLGDLGGFGPYPDRVFPILQQHDIGVVQGNYDHSVGNDLNDCQCGYTDPKDNYHAKLSYDYTYRNTSEENKRWMRGLPPEIRFQLGGHRVLLSHGSPRKTNEFLWESTTSTQFLDKLCRDYEADIICATHTGIHWHRKLTGSNWFVNVGVIGRPENNGQPHVGYTLLERGEPPGIHYVPVSYDHHRLAGDMGEENLPDPFIETILTGWWTTCLEILPAKERRNGKY
jgi:predicted phosphodiesterase